MLSDSGTVIGRPPSPPLRVDRGPTAPATPGIGDRWVQTDAAGNFVAESVFNGTIWLSVTQTDMGTW